MNRAAIIASYEENERAARAIVPGKFLLIEDCRLCVRMAAEENGVTYEQARGVLLDHWRTEAN